MDFPEERFCERLFPVEEFSRGGILLHCLDNKDVELEKKTGHVSTAGERVEISKVAWSLELVSKESNHLAILHVYAGGLIL